MMLKLYCAAMSAKAALARRLRDEKGSHTVEVVIFIAIVVALGIIFRDKVTELINKIFNNIDDKVMN